MTTETTSPLWTYWRNVLKGIGSSCRWNVENCQIRTPNTTRTIQNNKLLRVEFNLRLLTALLSRVSRLARGPGRENPRQPTAPRPRRFDPIHRRRAAGRPAGRAPLCDPPG